MGAAGGPRARGWTRTASGSTPASPRDGSTPPRCIASWYQEGFGLVPHGPSLSHQTPGPGRQDAAPRERGEAEAHPASLAANSSRLTGSDAGRNGPPKPRPAWTRSGRPALMAAALDLADEFTALIRKRSTGTLREWLRRAEVSPCPEVRQFAEGIRRDESAVDAAVTTRWSNGPVEGHVNRLKMIKRQMYGRAGFALLKARVVNVGRDRGIRARQSR